MEEGIRFVKELAALLQNRGYNLTKWVSNNPLILQAIPTEKHARSVVELKGEGGYERVLGVHSSLVDDCFKFRVRLPDKPITRSGMLFVLCSLFDPLGFVAHAILTARLILQDLCCRK